MVHCLNSRIDGVLRQYFTSAVNFRGALRSTKSVIAGSCVLNLLDIERAKYWTPNDLDIYCPSEYTLRMVWYLCQVEHYNVSDVHISSYSGDSAGFKRVVHLEKEDRRIDVIQSATLSALHPIPFFWGTHLVNYISADSFCLAYPTLTLQGRGLLNPISLIEYRYVRQRTLDVLRKYESRGYDFRLHPTAWGADPTTECDGREGCPRAVRYFGDRCCLTGSLRVARDTLYIPSDPVDRPRTVRWWRGGDACGGLCVHPHPQSPRHHPRIHTVRARDVLGCVICLEHRTPHALIRPCRAQHALPAHRQ